MFLIRKRIALRRFYMAKEPDRGKASCAQRCKRLYEHPAMQQARMTEHLYE